MITSNAPLEWLAVNLQAEFHLELALIQHICLTSLFKTTIQMIGRESFETYCWKYLGVIHYCQPFCEVCIETLGRGFKNQHFYCTLFYEYICMNSKKTSPYFPNWILIKISKIIYLNISVQFLKVLFLPWLYKMVDVHFWREEEVPFSKSVLFAHFGKWLTIMDDPLGTQ